MVRWAAVLVMGGVVLGCGKVSDPRDGAAPSGGNAPTGGASNDDAPSAGGAAGSLGSNGGSEPFDAGTCRALASEADIAATPRADTNLELLALHLSPGQLVAKQATYDRLVRDITAIRAQNPKIADIAFFARTDGRSLGLNVDRATGQAMLNDTYRDWDCLNQLYGKTKVQVLPEKDGSSVTLTLKGIYDIDQLAPLYAGLNPQFSAYYAGAGGGDGPTICVTQDVSDLWWYSFDRASGDCLAGCTEHDYQLFSTNDAGRIAFIYNDDDTGSHTKGCR